MTTGQCVDCWLKDKSAEKSFQEDARMAAGCMYEFMYHAPLTEFDSSMALDSFLDCYNSDDEAFPIDPYHLACDCGEAHASVVVTVRSKDDTDKCGYCNKVIWIGYDAGECETCSERYDHFMDSQGSISQTYTEFQELLDGSDKLSDTDFEEYKNQFEFAPLLVCPDCEQCKECATLGL